MKRSLVGLFLASLGLFVSVGPTLAETKSTKSHPETKTLAVQELAKLIDRTVTTQWKANTVKPASIAQDTEFLRRVYLDLTGRIPRVSEVRAFLAEKKPNKRERIINELLGSGRYVSHFGNTFRDIILPATSNVRYQAYRPQFEKWLETKLRSNVGYDKIVRELLSSTGTQAYQGRGPSPLRTNFGVQAFYFANERKPELVAATTAKVFLGVRIDCAQCHDHPFAKWERKHFWEFAAFFSSVSRTPVVRLGQQKIPVPYPGKIKIPKTGTVVEAKFLNGEAPRLDQGSSPQAVLAEWITSPKNPYFARNTVNRLWAHLFGIGIVDPVDEEAGEANPPSHPKLLDALADQFVRHDFDIQYIVKAIMLSETYQRTSKLSHKSQEDPRLFARMSVKAMTPEQLFDSLVQATGYQAISSGRTRYVLFNRSTPRARFLADFKRTDYPTTTQTSILQALALMNGKVVSDATSLRTSQTLTAIVEAPFFTTKDKISTLYLATLSRLPRETELKRVEAYVQTGGARRDEKEALGDVFWALLNTPEFRFNH
ncbi:MAG: DUF1549 and DUF1553 domain-containing protein [Gemmataceae bacterium]